MPIVYIAEPLDQGTAGKKSELAAEILTELGFTCYRPGRAFQVAGPPTGGLQRVNEAAIAESDGVMAFMRAGVASVGVPAEVQMAIDLGKPVVLVSDLESSSWVVAGWRAAENFRSVALNSKGVRQGVDWLAHAIADLAGAADEDGGPNQRVRSTTRYAELERKSAELLEQTQHKINWLMLSAVDSLRDKIVSESTVPVRPESIVFERKAENAQLPERAYDTDAGFDLFVSRTTYVPAGKTVYVPCGVAVDVPDGWWGLITGRSSTKHKRGLDVTPGVIDEGFSGELFAAVTNPHPHAVTINEGDRVVQIVFIPAVGSKGAEWGTVRPKPRGDNGFGSSGKADMHESPVPAIESKADGIGGQP